MTSLNHVGLPLSGNYQLVIVVKRVNDYMAGTVPELVGIVPDNWVTNVWAVSLPAITAVSGVCNFFGILNLKNKAWPLRSGRLTRTT